MNAVTISRRRQVSLGSCVLVLALAACGGGGEADPVSKPTAVAPATLSQPDAVALAVSSRLPKPAPSAQRVKWHPGHYVALPADKAPDPRYLARIVAELQANPVLRGVQIRYTWAELEPERGQYDFSRLERDLELMAAAGKQLFILLQTKSFDGSNPAPDYLDAETAAGATYAYAAQRPAQGQTAKLHGYNIRLWDTQVRTRLSALTAELGKRFNAHPALEGVAMTETALSFPLQPIERSQVLGYFANLLQVHARMREVFPNTVTIQYTNYPVGQLSTFVPGLHRVGAGLGGPDVFLAPDSGLANGVYPYYREFAGRMPMAPSVQDENYFASEHGGSYAPPLIEDIYTFARNDLRANYLFWSRVAYPKKNPWAKVLIHLGKPEIAADPAGGLATACPTVYPACAGDTPGQSGG